MNLLLLLLGLLAPVVAYVLTFFNNVRKRKNDPHELPGPTLFPLIGRVHDLPIEFMWLKFKEWADIYGPIYRTEMLGAKFIIISDEKIAEDLLVKRAKFNSDRPAVQSLFDSKSTHGSMEYLPLMGKNQYWARQRRFGHGYLTQGHNAGYYGFMDHEVKRWLYRLVTDPDGFNWSLEDMAAKIMCHLVWDDDTHSPDLIPSAWGLLTQMSPAGPITNILTPLWHLPEMINPWKKAEHKRHDKQQAWWMDRYLQVEAEYDEGIARPSFTRQFIETEKSSGLSGALEASSALGMLALVGVFTIGGPLNYFLLAMVYHPQCQARAQQEIDEQLGGRQPVLADMEKLPYLRACIREAMRWRPNVPTGVAHEAEQDDYYNGYFIEKGTRLLPLDWAFLRNPVKYPDPENFRPERWVESGWPTYQEPLTQYPTVKGMSSFGYGQRQCLGMTLTQDELVIACGGLLWAFTMKKKIDPKTGIEIDPPLNKSNTLLIIKPDPFEMAFEPRSDAKKELIVSNWLAAEKQAIEAKAEFTRIGRKIVTEKLDEKKMPLVDVLEVPAEVQVVS